MSRNSKSATRHAQARRVSEMRKKGEKGPAKTTPKHGKKRAWWQMFQSYHAFAKGAKARKADE